LGWDVNVLDLRGHGRSLPIDLAAVTMEDYLADIESVTEQISRARGAQPVIGGWSMGGMLAMMYAVRHPETPALLLIEPSPPLEVAGRPAPEQVRTFSGDVIGPETLGIYPGDPGRSREMLFDLDDAERAEFLAQSQEAQEAGLAFRQNLRGISIPPGAVRCQALVVYGQTQAREKVATQNRQLALYLAAESIGVAEAGHWGVVYSERAVAIAAPRVDDWLRRVLTKSQASEGGIAPSP
jgi:pimeloyl-ACP methyl ester carboxylesterase